MTHVDGTTIVEDLVSADELVARAFASMLRPDRRMRLAEWADEYRVLSSVSSGERGRYRSSRTPYIREPMDCLSTSSPVRTVVLMFASQLGKTEAGQNWIGYVADQAPAAMMMVLPTIPMCERASRTRIDALFTDTPKLSTLLPERKGREPGNTVLEKHFPGGVLALAGANKPSGLRSMPFRYLFADEIDAYPATAGIEGDPLELARRGVRTFGSRWKELLTSTPTVKGRSRIESRYLNTDQRRYWVPCPLCGEFQLLVWSGIQYAQDRDGQPIVDSVRYRCAACEELFGEHHKAKMLAAGEWRADHPAGKSNDAAGFHLNALYSPLGWFSWRDAVDKWRLTRNPDGGTNPLVLVEFVNTVLGETWTERGAAPPWESLYRRRETYRRGTVPRGGLVLTAGVDVQLDRLELEIVAWGRDRESWSIDYIVIPGDTAGPGPWKELERIRQRFLPNEDGVELPIRMTAVDAGDQAQTVYGWTRSQPRDQVMATRGRGELPVIVGPPKPVDVTIGGRKHVRGARVWGVGVNLCKSELYGWLGLEEPVEPKATGYPPGFCHFPEYPPEYFRGLTVERLEKRASRDGSRVRYTWECPPGARNEPIDCRVYARAAASVVGIDRWREADWAELESHLGAPPKQPTAQRKRRPRKGHLGGRGRFRR